jgi:hypothetical protein
MDKPKGQPGMSLDRESLGGGKTWIGDRLGWPGQDAPWQPFFLDALCCFLQCRQTVVALGFIPFFCS